MKKFVLACLVLASFCALGQAAKADYYGRGRGRYYHGGRFYGRPYGYHGFYRPYGYYPFFGPSIYFGAYYPPPPAYCYPPPRPAVYEGRVVPETRAPQPDYSK